MTTLERVSEFFQELTKLGLFDHMAGMSDLTHPDKINSLCDAVDAAIEKEPKPKLYTLQMWGCVEPNLYGPYANEDERVAEHHTPSMPISPLTTALASSKNGTATSGLMSETPAFVREIETTFRSKH